MAYLINGIVDVQPCEFFEFNIRPSRGHQYKLYKNVSCVRSTFLVNVLLMCVTLYLTVPILVQFLGLGALFNVLALDLEGVHDVKLHHPSPSVATSNQ